MPTPPSLPDRLKGGKPLFSAWCSLPDPAVAGLLAREDFDAVALDLQHGAGDLAGVLRTLPLVAAAGKPALVRIPVGDFGGASRLLDAGAAGVIAPMINTLDDARRFAASMKYPPIGERSWGPHGALVLSGLAADTYFRQANGLSLAFAMVETREALGIIDEILAVPGIDGVFMGPSDLSIALSQGRALDPDGQEVERALDHALARIRAAGKVAAVYALSASRAAELARRRFDLVAVASDVALLRAGAQAALSVARGERGPGAA